MADPRGFPFTIKEDARVMLAADHLLAALEQVEWTNAVDGGIVCPWCGNRKYDGHAPRLPAPTGTGEGARPLTRFDSAAPVASRRVPRQLVAADAGVPTALVIVIGGLVTVTTYALLTALFRASRQGDYWRLMPATRFWASVFVGGAISGWWLLWRWLRVHAIDALYTVEEFVGRDISGDGRVGVPTFRIEQPVDGGLSYWHLPGTPAQFAVWANAITSGTATTAERQWCGDGKLYDAGTYDDLRRELMERGVAEWKDPAHPQQGWRLTRGGYAAVQSIARGNVLLPPPES